MFSCCRLDGHAMSHSRSFQGQDLRLPSWSAHLGDHGGFPPFFVHWKKKNLRCVLNRYMHVHEGLKGLYLCVCIYMFLHAPVACIHICIYDYHWISACTVYVCLLCIHACVCSVRASEGTFGYVKVCVSGHTWKNMATINYSSEKKSPMTSKLLNIHLQSPSSCLAFQVWFRGKMHTHTRKYHAIWNDANPVGQLQLRQAAYWLCPRMACHKALEDLGGVISGSAWSART